MRPAAIGVLVALAGAARAGEAPPAPTTWLGDVYDQSARAIDATIAARVPPLRPPVPVTVSWKPQRLASIDLGAPLVELAAADLDGDGKAELIALTTRDLVVLGARGKREVAVLGRIAVPKELAASGPRAPVGTIAIARTATGAEVLARVSTASRGARYRWDGHALTEVGAVAGFPLCTGGTAELGPARDAFGDGPTRRYAVRCADGLVDPSGRAMVASAALGPGDALEVALHIRCAAADPACPPDRRVGARNIGVAFAIADVDRDGRPELIAAADGAPGDPDQVTVYPIGDGGAVGKPMFRRKFTGGVAAIAAADLDGDGDLEVVAAVRLVGAARIDLWFLA